MAVKPRTEWAEDAARRFLNKFSASASIDTADYQLCSFALAAAAVALEDKAFAEKIGVLMKPPRIAKLEVDSPE
jgi:hypothetical protein